MVYANTVTSSSNSTLGPSFFLSLCFSFPPSLSPSLPPALPPSLPSLLDVGPSASLSKLNPANLTSWSVEDVSQWLTENSLGQFMDIFSENLIDGDCLMSLTNGQLKEDLGITALGHRSRIMKRVHELKVMMHPSLS